MLLFSVKGDFLAVKSEGLGGGSGALCFYAEKDGGIRTEGFDGFRFNISDCFCLFHLRYDVISPTVVFPGSFWRGLFLGKYIWFLCSLLLVIGTKNEKTPTLVREERRRNRGTIRTVTPSTTTPARRTPPPSRTQLHSLPPSSRALLSGKWTQCPHAPA